MKYIVLEIQTNTDGTIGTLANAYDVENEAMSAYHTKLASAALSDLPMHSVAILLNNGELFAREVFRHEVSE